MKEFHAELFYPAANILGESAFWHADRKSCFWVDINKNVFFEMNPKSGQVTSWPTEGPVSLIVAGKSNDMFLGLFDGIYRFNIETGVFTKISDLGRDWDNHRCNDGGVDCEGRLWVGTTDREHIPFGGALYLLQKNGKVQEKMSRVSISNGMVWSLDNTYLYHIDSPTKKVNGFHFDAETGDISFDKVIIETPDRLGSPDGMTIDSEGMLWIAHWGGFGVGRWNPGTGEQIAFVHVPAPHVSSCVFMGEDLDELMITTARKEVSEEDLLRFPQSGNLFRVKTNSHGVKRFVCNL